MREYIEIPLENEELISKLSDEQVGKLFQALFTYVFDNIKPDFSEDSMLKGVFSDFIRQCRKTEERGLICCTTTFEDYVEE